MLAADFLELMVFPLFLLALFPGVVLSFSAVVWAHIDLSENQPQGFPIEPTRRTDLAVANDFPPHGG